MIVSGYRAWASQRRLDKSAKAMGDKARMVSNTAQQVANSINPKEARYSDAIDFLDRNYSGEMGALIGGSGGAIIGSIAGHLWGRKERMEVDKLRVDFKNSLSSSQKKMYDRLEEINDIVSTSSDGMHSIGSLAGSAGYLIASGVSNIVNAKYIAEANRLSRDFEKSYTNKQAKLVNRMGELTSTEGLKTVGAFLAGTLVLGTAGYLIDKHTSK